MCELRRAHPRWGARRIAFEVAQRGVDRPPSRATVHRVLERNGLVVPQAQRHKRKYKRWARETPMALWQMDLVGGIYLADGRECKMLSGIDDHSRFVVCATVLAIPSGRAVADAFTAAMKSYGVPSEVLTDNGKQFTGRCTKPRPAEVLSGRVCREHGITAKLTGPYSPTTTGKVERWHRTLRRELLDEAGPFADLPSAQAAISAWVHAYNHARPHQALDMATPASLFRPGVSVERESAAAAARPRAKAQAAAAGPVPRLVLSPFGQAVEFETVISAAGVLSVLPRVQRLKLGPAMAGQIARVWADEVTVHVTIGGRLVKTVPSSLSPEDLAGLRMRGAAPAGPPPAMPAPARAALPAGTVIEVTRTVDVNGNADLAGRKVKIGAELARGKVKLRLDGHLLHVINGSVLAKTLPSAIPAEDRGRLRGARIAGTSLPAPAPGPVSVQRKVPRDGVIMVTRQRLRVGAAYAGKIVTVDVEDTYFRVTCDGTEVALHPATSNGPSTGGEPRSTPRSPKRCPVCPEIVNQLVSRSCQACPETTHTDGTHARPRCFMIGLMMWTRDLWRVAAWLLATAGSLVTALVIVKAVLDRWRRGPGRRRQWACLFAQLALQVRADYVIGLFGEPAYMQHREGRRLCVSSDASHPEYEIIKFTERIWLLADDGYLQILTDELDNVVRYSLTTRNRRFHPRIPVGGISGNVPSFSVELGRTLFTEIPGDPDRVYRGPSGATAPYEYRQSYYYGRTGGYADWTCTYNAAGLPPGDHLTAAVPIPAWEQALSARSWLAGLNDDQRDSINRSRASTVVNTITIEHPQSDRSGKISYGPDRELVRLMPSLKHNRLPRLLRARHADAHSDELGPA